MNKIFVWLLALFIVSMPLANYADEPVSATAEQNDEQGSARVMQAFTNDKSEKSELVAIEDKTKRQIMFFMGVPLLLLIIATVSFGVAMVVYRKPVFVQHMVCAGLSLTLALGHAVVGIVWFYPF